MWCYKDSRGNGDRIGLTAPPELITWPVVILFVVSIKKTIFYPTETLHVWRRKGTQRQTLRGCWTKWTGNNDETVEARWERWSQQDENRYRNRWTLQNIFKWCALNGHWVSVTCVSLMKNASGLDKTRTVGLNIYGDNMQRTKLCCTLSQWEIHRLFPLCCNKSFTKHFLTR